MMKFPSLTTRGQIPSKAMPSFLRQKGGGVVTCAGKEVDLVPSGEHARERIQIFYNTTTRPAYRDYLLNNKKAPPQANLQYMGASRSTRCDSDGRFTFKDVAPGSYFIITSVSWQIVDRYGIKLQQGGSLMHPVTFTEDDEIVEIILSQ